MKNVEFCKRAEITVILWKRKYLLLHKHAHLFGKHLLIVSSRKSILSQVSAERLAQKCPSSLAIEFLFPHIKKCYRILEGQFHEILER
jgi:dihydropteroate synthase